MERLKEFGASRLAKVQNFFIYKLAGVINLQVNWVLDAPVQVRQTLIEKQVGMLNRIVTRAEEKAKFPNFFHYQLGRCYLALEQRGEALSHFERALLLHSDPSNIPDLRIYVEAYLGTVRTISQNDGILNLRGRNRLVGIRNLERVIESTGKVVAKYPDIEEIGRERSTAARWIQQTTGKSG